MSIRIHCPTCQQPCRVGAESVGKAVRCPGCRRPFTVSPPCPGRATLTVGCATSAGRLRERNEDSHLVHCLTWATRAGAHQAVLAVVADGMGGHEAGDRASAVAIAAAASALLPRLAGLVAGTDALGGEEALDALDQALWQASRAVAAEHEPGCAGMGSTAVAALVVDGLAALCHVGDCRAYLYRDGRLEQKTRDQTLVNRMVDLGTLTEREARGHPDAGQVTQALGRQYTLEPSRLSIQMKEGDRLVLASDGLHAHLGADELSGLIAAAHRADLLASTLVARADAAGGSDNGTAVVVWFGA